jgi:UDP-N-acetyl-D-mannosaminuronic acid dehydrogenase
MAIIASANSLEKGQHHVNILAPSSGVGGYCLTKDPWFVHALGKQNGIDLNTPQTSRYINDMMPGYCAHRIFDWIKKNRENVADSKIAVLGLSFKSGSGDVRFTPVIPFIKKMHEFGFRNIQVYDPMVHKDEAARYDIVLNGCLENVIEGADCVAFLVSHEAISDLVPSTLSDSMSQGGLVFDGRRYFSRPEINEIKRFGLSFCGVGR